MTQCIVADPSASGALYASAADPCTSMIALSPMEYAALANSPFNLAPEDGATIAGAVVAVWAAAWAFKALYLVVRNDPDGNE